MGHLTVKKSSLKGAILIPASKSHTLRAILFAALAKGRSCVQNYLSSTDAEAMIHACQTLGAKVDVSVNKLEIIGLDGKVELARDVIQSGNSGIVLRFASAVGALAAKPVVVTGDHSIRYHRPMKPLIEGLRQLGVSVESMRGDDMAPVIIKGPLRAGSAALLGIDSQPVSALLIASAFIEGPVEIAVHEAGEKPWINLTLDWFDRLGIKYEQENFERYKVPGRSRIEGFDYTVPGDLSSMAFPLVAALVTDSELTLHNIDMNDSQGDKELIYLLQRMGARIEIDAQKRALTVKRGSALHGIDVDINSCIDAITILAVCACYAEGKTVIRNAAIAKQKECNRIHAIATELKKMQALIEETADGLIIHGGKLNGAELFSHHDHRMAMSLTVASLGAEGESHIRESGCIQKTYPSFVRDMAELGANIVERQ